MPTLTLKIGMREMLIALDLHHAADLYSEHRDASGEGASTFPPGRVFDESGRPIARISYNGRVWPPARWQPGMAPLIDNR